ncbi:efflux RND transporter periplasmic adaptor subunit [Eoetvoesiella caeni]|uniref:Multidrug efflux system membrane fusion protein n=1 Tax=Eoetvoesiella caeni TaxID=645616 RepID=A0A366HC34_9BURK|nr:efflux RND transporter periplasmic adaptor subunit [Eoetvoesiella caeni]MCI2809100.1 efflux RND transporter periplasmic adaptor subunit [Eoetvoesiella caeni]NYT55399.1 efflux RND transporter periplasmic adaptor subunit [Eoetvoesiella caeni]RBP39950.1 multidrug efflux system membrane fusion protein [Eoetvoesiella caeni]
MATYSLKWRWVAGLLLVLAAGIWLVLRYGDKAPAAARSAPVVVTTTLVRQHDIPIYLMGVGTVVATQSVTVKARIDGQLDKVGFTEGQDVSGGQLLAQLDPRVQQAQLDQALAQKAKDKSQLANARLDLHRYTELMKQNATTRQILDTQRALVAQLEAALQFDDAQISAAQTQLSFTRITAPIRGRVGARLVDPGNIVHAGDANGLVVINQIDPISVVFTLPEESFQDINHALRSSAEPLAVEAYPRKGTEVLGRGRLVLLDNRIDTDSGTVQLKGSFANEEHKLWPGQYVRIHLILGQRKQALTVPAAVVQRGPDGIYAYAVAADDTVHIQPIELIGIQDGLAVVGKGLRAGQRVVIDGQYKLKPGLKVVESQAVPDAAAAEKGKAK